MRHTFRWDKKYLYWGITAFCVIAASILFFLLITRFPDIGGAIAKLTRILSPFIWGLVIAYLLAPLMKRMEKHLFLPLGKRLFRKTKKKGAGFARTVSVVFSLLIFLLVLVALFYLILPQLYQSIKMIVDNSSTYIDTATSWAEKKLAAFPELEAYVTQLLGSANENLVAWLQNNVLPRLYNVLNSVTDVVSDVLRAVYNLLVGIVVSLYILGNLEKVKAGFKRLLYSLFSLDTAEKIRAALDFTDKTFMGFISGKLLDSAIIGMICYIVCAIVGMPYALLVSVIVGITNVIPFFGPFIGAVPSALIILLVNPIKCLIFIIFIIILQQVDGNIIGPKILGSSTGINGFWVMFAIIAGAGLFGFWGMLLGVPVFVVIYTYIDSRVKKRLVKNDLPSDMAEYRDIDRIDPVTHEIIRREAPAEAEVEAK